MTELTTENRGDEELPDRYFSWMRSDVLSAVPENARRILSVGCGSGMTESALVKRGALVVGIEVNPDAARRARLNGLTVVGGDATQASNELKGRTFDCLIYADVLEHIVDPIAVLRAHVSMLESGGTVVISIPNFRYYEVLHQLFVRGHFQYQDAGIFDRTHVRITTRRMVQEWFEACGLETAAISFRVHQRRHRLVNALSLGLLTEFVAKQVIVAGRKG